VGICRASGLKSWEGQPWSSTVLKTTKEPEIRETRGRRWPSRWSGTGLAVKARPGARWPGLYSAPAEAASDRIPALILETFPGRTQEVLPAQPQRADARDPTSLAGGHDPGGTWNVAETDVAAKSCGRLRRSRPC
jgi:hypothetical protein